MCASEILNKCDLKCELLRETVCVVSHVCGITPLKITSKAASISHCTSSEQIMTTHVSNTYTGRQTDTDRQTVGEDEPRQERVLGLR